MNRRLELLKRKNIGKNKLENYESSFRTLSFLERISLEESDIILENLNQQIFPIHENELIEDNGLYSFLNSKILKEIYLYLNNFSHCFIFTDNYFFCGLFLTNAKEAIANGLLISQKDAGNTCFILDCNYLYYIKINYYDKDHNDYPDKFEIHKKSKLPLVPSDMPSEG